MYMYMYVRKQLQRIVGILYCSTCSYMYMYMQASKELLGGWR